MMGVPLQERRRFKHRWLKIHRWLGVGLGLPLALLGLTGAMLLVARFLIELQHGPILTLTERNQYTTQSSSTLIEAAQQAGGEFFHVDAFAAPGAAFFGADTALVVGTLRQEGQSHQVMFSVDPSDASIRGSFPLASTIAIQAAWFHQRLLLPLAGDKIVITLGFLLAVSGLSGLYLWWPVESRWRSALWLRKGMIGFARLRDIHTVSGFYLSLALLVLAISGIWIARPEGLKSTYSLTTAAGDCAPVGSMSEAVDRARKLFPSAQVTLAFSTPPTSPSVFDVRLWQAGDIDSRDGDTIIGFDRGCGYLLLHPPLLAEILGPVAESSHSGRIAGRVGQGIVFISGLALPILYITGVLVWWRKWRAGRQLPRLKARRTPI